MKWGRKKEKKNVKDQNSLYFVGGRTQRTRRALSIPRRKKETVKGEKREGKSKKLYFKGKRLEGFYGNAGDTDRVSTCPGKEGNGGLVANAKEKRKEEELRTAKNKRDIFSKKGLPESRN